MADLSDLANLTLEEALSSLENREFSTVELVQGYLDRIDRLDHHVNAVIEVNPDALALAGTLDEERHRGLVRGPLHGIPVMIKHNIDTDDGMSTTAGSLALQGSIAPDDAFVIKRLRVAGALILGKTNLSEWGNMRSSRACTGWSSLGGQTRNPFDQSRVPGGSSSGSGVAVAMGMCAAAIGTETDGSVVIPSAMNSLVGIKPTVGLVGRTGIIPISHTQDTAGPMARTVKDAALLLSSMLGEDPEDAASIVPGELARELPNLDSDDLKGARVGIVRTHCGYHEGIDAIVEQSIVALGDCGAEVVDDVALTTEADLGGYRGGFQDIVFFYEIKAGLNAYLRRLGPDAPMKTIDDLIAFNIANADRTMPYFGQEQFLKAQAAGSLEDAEYLEARSICTNMAGRDGIDAALAKHRLDVLFAPTIGAPWPIDPVNGDHRSPCCGAAAAAAGYPHVTVPGGFLHGLPIGVSFFAGHLGDAKVIRYAYAFEQHTQIRGVPPLAM